MKTLLNGVAIFLLAATGAVYGRSDTLPVGTNIEVRTNETIDSKSAGSGRIFTGVVNRDVLDPNGNVAIPQGSNAELIVRNIGNNEMAVDLESISVGGQRYTVASESAVQSGSQRQGLGKNKRTAEFVGGGAVVGTIIGAVAGHGKGAAIGALAGGAAGAGTQVLTRGKAVSVPAESVLTFRLAEPLRLTSAPDTGYMKDGYHYHNH